ncbi:neuronal acetylcholine receptor subunit beta-3-like [Ostrea edulis]|uniref:neuronal acetylcholine receptor subunit beta-3-like n=1 Tax=Ostrea edulis TaxID=37623 RepID=UPI0024AF6FCF|nr:neuronal acetylcholine receptor subunit beta-3-like [Ostrea edulis]
MELALFLYIVFIRIQMSLCVSNIEDYILQNYSSTMKPRWNQNEIVNVSIYMSIDSVEEVDEKLQQISIFAWFNVQWDDEFLIWNETEYSEIKIITVPYQKVWVPDLCILNSKDNNHDLGPHPTVTVTSNGHVMWFPGEKIVATCDMKMTKFPFDEQQCEFDVSPWQITDQIQKLIPRNRSINDAKLISENGEWEIMTFTYSSEYLTEFDMTIIHYSLRLRRRYLYFVLNMLVPIMTLSILNSVTFFIPLESGERIQYSLTLFLAFTVFLTIFEKMMPQNSTAVPYISVYVGFQLLLCVISTVVSVVATSGLKTLNDTSKDINIINPPVANQPKTPNEDRNQDKFMEIDDEVHVERNNGIFTLNNFERKTNFAMILFNTVSQILSVAVLFLLYWI